MWKTYHLENPRAHKLDHPTLLRWNEYLRSKLKSSAEPFLIEFEKTLPEPFIGNINAPGVVFLAANPGYGEFDIQNAGNPTFSNLVLANHHQKEMDYPFYYLDPKLGFHEGYQWWKQRLRVLLETSGLTDQKLSNHICTIQLHGYRSKRLAYPKFFFDNPLPSQQFTKEAISRLSKDPNVLFVLMRSERLWTKLLGELPKNIIRVANPRSPYITPNNIKDEGFEKLLKHLKTNSQNSYES